MSELKHEPGPWVLGGCSGRMITTPDGYVGDGFIADVDTLANAKLISAAPELLEGLQAALEWIDAVPKDIPLPTMPGFDRDWVESVISKALGQ